MDVVAKGARKGGSRLAGSSEPLIHAIFHYAQGRAQRYITQVQPISSFPGLRKSYEALVSALAFCELIRLSIPYESPAPEAYHDLVVLLQALQREEEPGPALAWAAARLMVHDGRSPDWTECQDTGERVSERPAWVSPSAGGHVSRESARSYGDAFSVQPETLMALNKLTPLEEPPPRLNGWEECLVVLQRFWRHELHDSLKAFTSARESLTSAGLQ